MPRSPALKKTDSKFHQRTPRVGSSLFGWVARGWKHDDDLGSKTRRRHFLTTCIILSIIGLTSFNSFSQTRLNHIRSSYLEKEGFYQHIELLDQYGHVIKSFDLRHGEQVVGYDAGKVIFKTSDGRQYVLRTPFTGDFINFNDPDEQRLQQKERDETMLVLGGVFQMLAAFKGSPAGQEPIAPPSKTNTSTDKPHTVAPVSRESTAPAYTVIVNGSRLQCINLESGGTVSTANIPGSRLISGPTVSGDICTITVQTASGPKAYLMKLPSFSTITTMNVSP